VPIKWPDRLPTSSRTSTTNSPSSLSSLSPPPVSPVAFRVADRPPPSISLHSPSPTKVRSGMSCPRSPLSFAQLPGRPHGLGRRRPNPLHRPAILSLPFCIVREGGRRWLFCPYPLHFSPFAKTDPPPLFSHSFLSKQTLCFKLNHKNNPVPLQLCP
jgi:hypothetical protein